MIDDSEHDKSWGLGDRATAQPKSVKYGISEDLSSKSAILLKQLYISRPARS
jgi:hypothetical protein